MYRATIDQAVAIDEIKRFIAEQELKENTRFVPLCENHEGKQFTQKIAVIGAGPAGMSAAYYLRTKGYPVTIFEKESRAGGMLMNGIPSFRLEKSVIEAEIDILKQMGIEFRYNVEIGKDITILNSVHRDIRRFILRSVHRADEKPESRGKMRKV